MSVIKRILIGKPMESSRLSHEKLPKWKALPVFASDALSSVAYATEEILLALTSVAIVGSSLLSLTLPISVAILILLLMVTLSYRQIIKSFPGGGGAYIVAKEYIGKKTSLVAASSLMFDYILTVAVSISSGVAALTSAFPILIDYKVHIAVAFIILLMILNLRGITESATVFAFPTYIFVGFVVLMISMGIIQLATGDWVGYQTTATDSATPNPALTLASIFIILRAFAGGCSAMTGVEAISNGVPSFREKSTKNAMITLYWMSGLLAFMFIGISILAIGYGILPTEHETVISQIASNVFGEGTIYYVFQLSTTMILFLAANTSFAGFPQLASILARDGFLPRSLSARGDRLVFSNGIIMLSVSAIVLVIIFGCETHALIPLYAVGVFLSFTIAQIGLFRKVLHDEGKMKSKIFLLITSACGALVTGTVTVVTLIAKFSHGAWIVLIVVPISIYVLLRIKAHYTSVSKQLKLVESNVVDIPMKTKVIIPVSGISKTVDRSLAYATSISDDIVAFSVVFDEEQETEMREKWAKWYPNLELNLVYSKYRTLIRPLLDYITEVEKSNPDTMITIIIPQFVVKKWWHSLLHNQTAIVLKVLLILRKDIAITTIPFHLEE